MVLTMKSPSFKNKLRKPRNASQRRALAARDYYRRQQQKSRKSSNGSSFVDSEVWIDSQGWED